MSKESVRARIAQYEAQRRKRVDEDMLDASDLVLASTPIDIIPIKQEKPTATETRNSATPGPDSAISNLLINAINGEWDTIILYNDLITNLATQGMDDIADIIKDINNEENIHVGQLQKALEKLSPNAESIRDGEKEAGEQLDEPAIHVED